MSDLFDLNGKWALVTGARTGLGRALALTLAEAGADIVGLGSTELDDVGDTIRQKGRKFLPLICDLTTRQDFETLLYPVQQETGGLDILVNNAGIIRRNDLMSFPDEDWDEVVEINMTAAFRMSRTIARTMAERQIKGRIINVASLLSFQGGIRVASYTASKHGILGITRAMANELAPHGITVNAIAPGYMETDNTEALRNDPDRSRQILERIPAGRWGEPEDLATAVLFLASQSSGYITGTMIPVDGGWSAR
ncbi:2-dehydro-3-deoxy-D-gluconate 5-dehydrogenase KduD [Roseibium sp. SCP14]|uniref:2-dehydro-3-deoxy-D-gluconate 5-dehydrogenase KduD n=1 Tax=Roseibium sp. SCP14 TaxID=3141375 RepID=UPI00333D1186